MVDIGLNSTALLTIAQTMRDQNAPPNEEMPYSDYAGAVSTYAVINAMELLASGLKTEEDRQKKLLEERYKREIEGMRRANEWLLNNLTKNDFEISLEQEQTWLDGWRKKFRHEH